MNAVANRQVKIIDFGLIDYEKAWNVQTDIFNSILAIKKENRSKPENLQLPTENFLIFCEHPAVFTLGKSGNEKNLLIEKEKLSSIGATYIHANRGGDITFHGPGQIVVYPIIDMENFFTDIHRYMRMLEEAVILTLSDFSVQAGRIDGLTGVWIGMENSKKVRKICAMGVKTSRWVTMHGLAFNVNADLTFFNYIIPCGISDKAVTSLDKELGKVQDISKVKEVLKSKLINLFGMTLAN